MRSIFFILVLANVLFAAWQWWRPAQRVAARADTDDVPGIVLAHEVPEESAERRPGDGDGDGDGDRDGAAAALPPCVSVGPFRDEATAERAAERLRAAGQTPTTRAAEEDVRIGYWVYVADVGTEAAAGTVAARVRAGGVTDAYVVSDDDIGVVVSLGVFNERERADRQGALSREIGYEPTVVERTRRAAVRWLDVVADGAAAVDVPALQETLRTAETEAVRATELRTEACPVAVPR